MLSSKQDKTAEKMLVCASCVYYYSLFYKAAGGERAGEALVAPSKHQTDSIVTFNFSPHHQVPSLQHRTIVVANP